MKNFGKNYKFKQNLAKNQDIKILRTISLSHETILYPCFKPEIVSLNHKDPYILNMMKYIQNIEKFFIFLSKKY